MRAIVLCAGYGTRLGNLTRELPKPMLLLNGRPLLEYIIVHLGHQGFRQIAINLHFLPEYIKSYFGDGSRWKVTIQYFFEPLLLGTAGAVKKMADFLRQEDCFLVQYGDVLTNQDLTRMLEFHRSKSATMTMLVHQRPESNSIVDMDEQGRVLRFLERPTDEQRRRSPSCWVNSGVCICSLAFLEAITSDGPSDIPRDVLPKLVPEGRVYGFPLSGYRCAIDSPQRLDEARAAISEGVFKASDIGERTS